jgi:nitroreductase
MKFNITEIESCIQERRTIKPEQYSARKVHKEIIERLLNAAKWAPNHGMTQPWKFKVFTDQAIPKLADFMASTYKETTSDSDFKPMKFDKLKERPLKSSVVIAICMKRQESGKIPEIEEVQAVACAVQNLHLLATAYGLGGYWSSGAISYSKQMKGYLNLDEKDKCLGFFYLGYPDIDWPTSHRKPLEYNVDWISE